MKMAFDLNARYFSIKDGAINFEQRYSTVIFVPSSLVSFGVEGCYGYFNTEFYPHNELEIAYG